MAEFSANEAKQDTVPICAFVNRGGSLIQASQQCCPPPPVHREDKETNIGSVIPCTMRMLSVIPHQW